MTKSIEKPEPRYCENCGTKCRWQLHNQDEPYREVCPSCNHVMFRNSKPCAGVLVLNGAKILLIQRGIEPYKSWWDIPGGFLEEAEHPADGARREALEETGLVIEPVEILGIFIDKYEKIGFTHNTYFIGNVSGGELRPCSDAVDARWFDLNKLPDRIAFPDHALEVIEKLKQRIAEKA